MAMKIANLLSILLLFAAPLCAETGVVVKAQDSEVYIDISEFKEKPAAGTPFVIYEKGEELVNPVTGKKLGAELKKQGRGVITEVHDSYAKGAVSESSAAVKPGFMAEIEAVVKAVVGPAAIPVSTGMAAQELLWQSEPLPGVTVDAVTGDFDGDGTAELAVAQAQKISLYRRDGVKAVEFSSAALPGVERIISLDTLKAGFAGLKTDALVMNIYDSISGEIEAGVYALENGQLVRRDQLKWLVRAINAVNEEPSYYTQEIYRNAQFALSFIKPLRFADGRYSTGSARLDLPRVEWLYGLTVTDLDGDGKSEAVYAMKGGSISVQFEKRSKHFDTRSGFARTPNRVSIKGNMVYFYLRMPVVKSGKTAAVYAVGNIPAHMLSEAFGRYADADLSRFTWDGNTLNETARTKLGGAVYNVSYGAFDGLPAGIIVPVTTIDDTTLLKVFKCD